MKRVAIAMLLLGALFLLAGCDSAVPDVKGMTADQARKALESAGFRLGEVTYDENAVGAPGVVIGQEPQAGKTEAAARKLLEKAGFKVEVVSVESPAVVGTVISQKPASGKARPGSTVVITVSAGIDMVTVPRVIGLDAPDAEAALKAAGLQPLNVAHYGPAGTVDGQPADILQVYKQSPAAGSLVPRGTVVRIYWWGESG